MESSEQQPLLAQSVTVRSAVDYRSHPASRHHTGGWRAAKFFILAIVLEKFADFGLSTNLVTYLTGELGESTVAAAANVNAWTGVGYMLSLLAAFIADSSLGHVPTIVCSSLIYTMGMGLVTIYALFPSSQPECTRESTCRPTHFPIVYFYCSLYIVSIGQSSFRPPLQAFGAAQFDEKDPGECKSKSSFFNWWTFGMCTGTVTTTLVMTYIQENIGWGIGFGIPCIAMALSLLIFITGGRTYRYHNPLDKQDASVDQQQQSTLNESNTQEQCGEKGMGSEVAAILKLLPIWATSLVYAAVFAQSRTFFIKQGNTMDRRISPSLQIPSAALRSSISIIVVAFIPIYDRMFIPAARKLTGVTTGITVLQRIGTGLFFSMLSMLVAAMVEMKRLQLANNLELVDIPGAVVPMSVWWLIPQYVLIGMTNVFAMVGLQEFFYDQVPSNRKSLGVAIYYSVHGVGSFLSSCLVYLIDMTTRRSGESWFADNLNRGHLDYFYWLLAGINAIQLTMYMYFSRAYASKKVNMAYS